MRKYISGNRWEKLAGIGAFLVPICCMLLIFAVDGIYPFGDRSFLSTDLYHQYMPFFAEFVRAIRQGNGLAYTWNVGIGSNFLALYVYYLASPAHWLGLLVPESHFMEFLTYLVVVKIGLCGLSAYVFFIRRGAGRCAEAYRSMAALFFAMGYALSGFMAAYNWNIMWLDCVILLPLIVWGLERLVLAGKPVLYCLLLAFSIYTNYYISIMICIFLVLYFVYLFFQRPRAAAVRDFALYSLLAGGLAAVLLVPEVCAILATDFGDIALPDKVTSYFSVLDILMRHCVAVSVEKGLDHWPNIYCGAAVFLLVPLYAVNERIRAGRRLGMLALAGIMLLSFGTNVLDFAWHGLNYPDSLPGRQSFIYILLVLTMCFDGVTHLDLQRREERKTILWIYLGVAVMMLFVEKFGEHEDLVTGVEWLTLLFVTAYAVVLYQMYLRRGKRAKELLAGFAVLVMICETCLNTGITSVSNVSRSGYLEHLEDYRTLYEACRSEDMDFYRLEKFSRKTKNDGALVGYPTASVFSSTMNSAVMDLYERLGMRHSKVYYDYDGATALTSALLNVRYLFGELDAYGNSQYTLAGSSGEVSLYRAKATLPFGYVAPEGYDVPEGFVNSGLRLQNQMVYDLGIAEPLFESCHKTQEGEDTRFEAEQDGIYYGLITTTGTRKVKLVGSTPEDMTWNDLRKGSVLYLGALSAGDGLRITNNDAEDETKQVSAEVYRLNEEVLAKTLEKLSAQHLEAVTYDSTHITGTLSLQEAGRLILSVPYEKGWQVAVNGETTEPALFGGTFMAFDLEPGTYEIALHYTPYGAREGAVISLVSLMVLAVILGCGRVGRSKRTKRPQEPAQDVMQSPQGPTQED